MSVLIKGMEMPKSCFDCDMLELSGVVGCKHAYDTNNSEWGRALNCPLIELPDHGDLIDRDIVDRMAVRAWMRNSDGNDAMAELIEKIRVEVPAVIPAERSEDEQQK